MSEHDDAGSAVTFPPLPPPPPPHPAARSARTAAEPISAASESLLLTLPPQSPTGRVHRGPRPAAGASIGPFHRPFQPASAATVAGTTPKWRNWQTRRTQNPVPFGECGFDSHLRHLMVVRNWLEGAPLDERRGNAGGNWRFGSFEPRSPTLRSPAAARPRGRI